MQLLDLLARYNPETGDELECKARFIEFVQNNPDCFKRTLQSGHVTASAWLLNEDQDKILLMHHRKLDFWMQLGGHCDGNSDVLASAIREAQEESGILMIVPVSKEIFDIDIHEIPAIGDEPAHLHYDVRFLLRSLEGDNVVGNSESKDIKWFGIDDEIPSKELSVLRMYHKWRELNVCA